PSRCSSSSSSASARTREGVETLSPKRFPSATSATVATEVAVSKASVTIGEDPTEQRSLGTGEHDHSMAPVRVSQARVDRRRRQHAVSGLRPLYERDRVLEVRLQIAPLGRGDSL